VFGQRVEISAERNKPKDEDSSDTHVDVRRNTHKMLLKMHLNNLEQEFSNWEFFV